MNIEITIRATELAESINRLADAMATHAAVRLTAAKAAARTEGGEVIIPAGTPLTVTGVSTEPEKPKRTRKAKATEAETTPVAPQEPAVTPAEEPLVPTAALAQQPAEPAYEAVADHPAFADIAAEAKGTPTMDQIAAAGAKLLDDNPDAMPALIQLLSDYGVQAITYLKEDQLPGFAEQLRSLGAEV